MNLNEMLSNRAALVTQMREIMNIGDNIPAEKTEELKKLEAAFDKLSNSIDTEQKQLMRERMIGEVGNIANEPKRNDRMNAFLNVLRDWTPQNLAAYNALQQANPTQAGALVAPEQFVSEVIKELDNSLFFRQIARVLPPLVGAQSLGFPKRTARMTSAVWGTELSTPATDTALAFGKREFRPKPATLECLVSKTLLRNAANVDGFVREEMAFSLGVLQEQAYLTGDGAGKPLGVFTASADGISTNRDVSSGNTTTAITFDGLIAAKYALKEQYRKSKSLNWLFHRDAVKQIALVKDNDGQYIWQPAKTMSDSDIVLGVPVRETEYAPNTFTTGLYVGLLGDFSNYWIADSLTAEINVLTELYARTNQVDFISRFETDGMPVVEEAFARVKLG